MADLLDSLSTQEPPFEALIIDAGSTDGTQKIVQKAAAKDSRIRLLHEPGSRGRGRNAGALRATGSYLAFIDGDCIANPFWLERMRDAGDSDVIVAGRSPLFGYWAFERLQRVELEHRGQDVTHPSSNLFYPREAFLELGGFDERFVTAEDIDLNLRAVEAGLKIRYRDDAIVYHRARDSVMGFLRQAYWNGYGRKQLTLKHGELWGQYSFRRMFTRQLHLWGLLRLASATLGYLHCLMRETRRDWGPPALPSLQKVAA